MAVNEEKARAVLDFVNLAEQKYGKIPRVAELLGKVRAKYSVGVAQYGEVAGPSAPRSYGVGGSYGRQTAAGIPLVVAPGQRKAVAEEIQRGIIPPPGYDKDPVTGEYTVKRDPAELKDVLRSGGKLIEGFGGFIPAGVIHPEGIPQMAVELGESFVDAWDRIYGMIPKGASPLSGQLYGGDFRKPLTEVAQDPFGTVAGATIPLMIAQQAGSGIKSLAKKVHPKVRPKGKEIITEAAPVETPGLVVKPRVKTPHPKDESITLYRGFADKKHLDQAIRERQIYHPGHTDIYFTENYESALLYAKGKPENVAIVTITNKGWREKIRFAGEFPDDWYFPTDFKETRIPVSDIRIAKPPVKPPVETPKLAEMPKAEVGKPVELPQVEVEPVTKPKAITTILPPGEFQPQRVAVSDIGLKPKEIQFKLDINAEGVQQPLKGKWSELAGGNILLWQDKGGKYFVANGHHRLELAKRTGIEHVNAQVLRESDGFTIADARHVAAETNILEGRGTVYDHAEYFRLEEGYTPELAEAKGLKGQGYAIGKLAKDDLYAAFRNRQIKPDQAGAIAESAPNDVTGQRIGQQYIQDNPKADPLEVTAFIEAVRIRGGRVAPGTEQADMFGGASNAELAESARIARAVAKDRKLLQEKVTASRSAAKRPKKAGEMGVEVADVSETQRKIQETLIEAESLKKWYLDPELVRQYRKKVDLEEIPLFTGEPVDLGSGVDIAKPIIEKAQPLITESPATELAKIADESVRRFVGERESRRYEAGTRAQELKKEFQQPLSDRLRQFFGKEPKTQNVLQDMIFYRQKTRNPKIKGDTFEALEKRLPDRAKKAVEEFGDLADKWRQEANESGFGKDIDYIENWIHQRWKMSRKKAREIAGRTVKTKGAFENRRVFENFIKGMDKNYEPVTLNFADLAQFSETAYAQVIASRNLVAEIWEFKKNGITALDDRPFLELGTKAPNDYVRFDHPALKKFQYGGKTKKGETKLTKEDVYMHPDAAPHFEAVFQRPFHHKGLQAITDANQVLKGAWLRFSLFHNFTLSESSAAMLGMLRGGALAARLGGGVPGGKSLGNILAKTPGIKQAFKKLIPVAEELNVEMTKQWVSDGVKISPPSEAQLGAFRKVFEGAADYLEKVPIAGKPAALVPKAIVAATKGLDKNLWVNYHSPIKVIAAETVFRDMMRTKDAPAGTLKKWLRNAKNYGLLGNVRAESIAKMSEKQIRRQVASVINDGFGGQMWELMESKFMHDPRWRQIQHIGALSPDWVTSQLRIAGDVAAFKNPVKQAAAIRYWRNAALIYYISTNSMNYLMTALDPNTEARLCSGNPPGRKFDIFVGTWGGNTHYVSPGKQFREVPRMMTEGPLKWLGHKASPVLSITSEQFTGYSPGGFPSDLARKQREGPVTRQEEIATRLGMFGKQLTPFSLRGSNLAATFPLKKGLNSYMAREFFEKAYKTGDAELQAQAVQGMWENGYTMAQIIRAQTSAYNKVRDAGQLYKKKSFRFREQEHSFR